MKTMWFRIWMMVCVAVAWAGVGVDANAQQHPPAEQAPPAHSSGQHAQPPQQGYPPQGHPPPDYAQQHQAPGHHPPPQQQGYPPQDQPQQGYGYFHEPEPVVYNMTLAVAPLQLLWPALRVMGEYRAQDNLGVAGIAAIGENNGVRHLAAGGQLVWYPQDDFSSGIQLGGEILYEHYNTRNYYSSGVDVRLTGTSLGGFVGYKVAADFGLTFVAQGGVRYIVATESLSNRSSSVSAQGEGVALLLNLYLGWSF